MTTKVSCCRKQEFLEAEPECGVSRHRQFSKRIIGGEKAKFSELPWQAHIRISSYQVTTRAVASTQSTLNLASR